MDKKWSETGASLAAVLVAAAIGVVVISFMTRGLGTLFKASTSIGQIQDLETLKMTLRDSFDCRQTLGIQPNQLQASCQSNYTLKRANGEPLPQQIGQWRIQASCKDGALNRKSLVIEVKGLQADPMGQRDNSLKDLYRGMSDFCSGYLNPTPPCPAGQSILGYAGATPVCGKSMATLFKEGGSYDVRPYDRTKCRSPNPKTGKCSCPSGYEPLYMSSWAAGYRSFNSFYCDPPLGTSSNPPPGGCGYVSFLCIPSDDIRL